MGTKDYHFRATQILTFHVLPQHVTHAKDSLGSYNLVKGQAGCRIGSALHVANRNRVGRFVEGNGNVAVLASPRSTNKALNRHQVTATLHFHALCVHNAGKRRVNGPCLLHFRAGNLMSGLEDFGLEPPLSELGLLWVGRTIQVGDLSGAYRVNDLEPALPGIHAVNPHETLRSRAHLLNSRINHGRVLVYSKRLEVSVICHNLVILLILTVKMGSTGVLKVGLFNEEDGCPLIL